MAVLKVPLAVTCEVLNTEQGAMRQNLLGPFTEPNFVSIPACFLGGIICC